MEGQERLSGPKMASVMLNSHTAWGVGGWVGGSGRVPHMCLRMEPSLLPEGAVVRVLGSLPVRP